VELEQIHPNHIRANTSSLLDYHHNDGGLAGSTREGGGRVSRTQPLNVNALNTNGKRQIFIICSIFIIWSILCTWHIKSYHYDLNLLINRTI